MTGLHRVLQIPDLHQQVTITMLVLPYKHCAGSGLRQVYAAPQLSLLLHRYSPTILGSCSATLQRSAVTLYCVQPLLPPAAGPIAALPWLEDTAELLSLAHMLLW